MMGFAGLFSVQWLLCTVFLTAQAGSVQCAVWFSGSGRGWRDWTQHWHCQHVEQGVSTQQWPKAPWSFREVWMIWSHGSGLCICNCWEIIGLLFAGFFWIYFDSCAFFLVNWPVHIRRHILWRFRKQLLILTPLKFITDVVDLVQFWLRFKNQIYHMS